MRQMNSSASLGALGQRPLSERVFAEAPNINSKLARGKSRARINRLK